jgi:hypothetical protein
MDEYRAAAARGPWSRIVIDFDDNVVERIRAPQAIADLPGLQPDRTIIAAIRGVFAPSVHRSDRSDRQKRSRPWQAVRAPPKPDEPKASGRRGAVTFPLVNLDPAAAERHRDPPGPDCEPPLLAIGGSRAHIHIGERYSMHIVLIGRLSLRRQGAGRRVELALFPPIALLAARGTRQHPPEAPSWRRRAES